ncbi:hypothetical protein ANN_00818 [Periplaneta americana]|uniref:Uncharacterized protein n=1 Tax=Periplaneta americana TaxID=6978 RepID=A0ABQ8TV23_PERAM|nr:hypothetical protein ANN_00818 [Periplaneta americana]
MAGLCEDGNEPADSLKAICKISQNESLSFTTIRGNRLINYEISSLRGLRTSQLYKPLTISPVVRICASRSSHLAGQLFKFPGCRLIGLERRNVCRHLSDPIQPSRVEDSELEKKEESELEMVRVGLGGTVGKMLGFCVGFDPGPGRWYLNVLKCDWLMSVDLLSTLFITTDNRGSIVVLKDEREEGKNEINNTNTCYWPSSDLVVAGLGAHRKQNKRRQDQQQPVLMMDNSRLKHVNKLNISNVIYFNNICYSKLRKLSTTRRPNVISRMMSDSKRTRVTRRDSKDKCNEHSERERTCYRPSSDLVVAGLGAHRKQNKRRQDQQQPDLMMANSRLKHVNKLNISNVIYFNNICNSKLRKLSTTRRPNVISRMMSDSKRTRVTRRDSKDKCNEHSERERS